MVSLSFKAVLLKWGDDVHSTYRANGFKSAFSCRGLFRVTRLWLYPGWGTEVPEFSLQFARTYTSILLMEEILHQLRLVVYPMIYKVLLYIQTVVGNGISSINYLWNPVRWSQGPFPAVGGSFCWRWIQHHHYQPQQISMRRSRNVSWWRRVNWWCNHLQNTGRLLQANLLICFRKLRKELDSTD